MPLLDWPFLDALQAGALAVLCVSLGADALSRRDRMMGWLALACLLVGLRHATLALGTGPAVNPDLVDRGQSLLVALGFIALSKALAELFPAQVPPRFPLWIALGLIPNFLRNLVLPHPSLGASIMHQAANLTYLTGCGLSVYWSLRAREEGDPMGQRLLYGFVGVILPVIVEIASLSIFDLRIRLSGLSLVILATAIGTSWKLVVVDAMESRVQAAETEVEIWRSLLPGEAFRTDTPSIQMEELFGADWAEKVKDHPDTNLLGADGVAYRVRSRVLRDGERIGWYEYDMDRGRDVSGFLAGWKVGLGMDDPATSFRVQGLLKGWGAEVELWGTVPPREGPYPSILLWGREPSILSVWRENDMLRRRPRWVQIGGPETQGPHARLEPLVPEESLRRILEELLSRR